MMLIDTAGIRRKGKVTKEDDVLEGASVFHAIRAMERCDVAVLLCDGAEGVAEQDAKILGLAVDRGRAIIIAVNKTDLLDGAGAQETRRPSARQAELRPLGARRAHLRQDGPRRGTAPRRPFNEVVTRLPLARLDRAAQPLLRAGAGDAPAAHAWAAARRGSSSSPRPRRRRRSSSS